MDKVGNYWHLFPLQTQARKAIWKGINKDGIPILDQVFPPEIVKSKNGTEMIIELINGSTWQLCGSDNYNSLVGANPVGVVFSEWSLCDPNSWAYIRPILAENGGWSWFIYTPRGKNHAYTMQKMAEKNPNWYADTLTVTDTNAIAQETLDEEEDEMDESDFLQEYYCSFDAALKGTFYSKQFKDIDKTKRITVVKHDPSIPVYTAWDLGLSDDTAIWFYQVVFGEIHVIDYYCASGENIDHYAEQVTGRKIKYDEAGEATGLSEEFAEDAEHRAKYNYTHGSHGLPHDAKAKTLASNGKSVQEQLAKHLEWGNIRIVAKLSIQDGIQAARMVLKSCWFDEERTEVGVNCLRSYQREYDEKAKIFKKVPLHNWASHGADAFRYLAVMVEAVCKVVKDDEDKKDRQDYPEDEDAESWR